ncbi:MAG: hypothetical protein ABJB34_08320, partial [Acidobacteriota bacterium]
MARLTFSKSLGFKHIFSQGDNDPIREELFSVERLEQFAATLAADHKGVGLPKRFKKLRPRLEDNGAVLIAAYYSLTNAIREEQSISPAAEWLVDNFHIVEEQLREIAEDLPAGYYRELPKLTQGEFAGYPRIYAVAMAIIGHTDSRLDVETLERFLRAYQTVSPLTIGELWAIAITLRFVLVENLRRLAWRIVVSREERREAQILSDELLELASKQPERILPLMTKRLGKRERFETAFVEQLTRQLRDQDLSIAQAYDWLTNKLEAQDSSIEQIVEAEYHGQATAQVTVGNIVTSMRLLSTIDWTTFFEGVSLIDPLLRTDPANVYSTMNFTTRNRYRGAIERIAKNTNTDELTVASRVIEFAAAAHESNPQDERYSHIGYYLIDEGLPEIEGYFNYRPDIFERFVALILRHPSVTYIGLIAFLTTVFVTLIVLTAAHFGAEMPTLIGFALLSIMPASELALSIANWDLTRVIAPRLLAQIDTSAAVPESARTFVVIPTLLTSGSVVKELLEKLEVYSLANQDDSIYFALLSDFADAPAENMAEDPEILDVAQNLIKELNEKYQGANGPKFNLFHRRRQWNEAEGKWMGWERKRGKLEEFNRLLRGAEDTSFTTVT